MFWYIYIYIYVCVCVGVMNGYATLLFPFIVAFFLHINPIHKFSFPNIFLSKMT